MWSYCHPLPRLRGAAQMCVTRTILAATIFRQLVVSVYEISAALVLSSFVVTTVATVSGAVS